MKTITTYAGDLTRNCPVLERGNARVTTLRSALQWKNYQDKIGFSTEFRGQTGFWEPCVSLRASKNPA